MERRVLIFVVILGLAGPPAPAAAWNKPGHMVSGAIAYQVLKEESPAALAKAVELLKTHPYYQSHWEPAMNRPFVAEGERELYLFMLAARWADDVRDDRDFYPDELHLDRWHYINIPYKPLGQSVQTAPFDPNINLFIGYEVNSRRLMGKEEAADRAVALAWMMHLIGDVHQPLHTASLFTDKFPSGDRGGTLFFIKGETAVIHLHHFWDELIIHSTRFQDVRDRAIGLRNQEAFKRVNLGELSEDDFQNWAQKESLPLAKEKAYQFNGALLDGSPNHQGAVKLPDGYGKAVQPVAERRVVLAGYRIAQKIRKALE